MSTYLTIPVWLLRRSSLPMAVLLLVALATSQAQAENGRLEHTGETTCCLLNQQHLAEPQAAEPRQRCKRSTALPAAPAVAPVLAHLATIRLLL